jgi:CRISPR-associated endonuclease/helicase Cas3
VEDHPPSGQSSPQLDQQRREALRAAIAEADATDLSDSRPRILTLPTGLGKTRCAAAWAFHLRDRIERETGRRPKILVVLPFLSIIEQTARVYRRELLGMGVDQNDETLGVSHSLSMRDYGDLEEPDRAEFALGTWRSDVILTTFDQFLMALMDARTKCQQRFHNLCDAIIVLDEVQAFPCRLWHPVGHVLRELASAAHSRLLLMTATQPGLLESGNCVPVVRDPASYGQARYRLEFDPRERHLTDWLPELSAEITRPENAEVRKWLVVFNTRRAAQDAYRFFCEARPFDQLFLLSSDIVPLHRLERIDKIREASSCLVISTQCVEAGIDLDMHRVIRDFGPLDSLIQVAGRCNRHGLRPRSKVCVVCLSDDRKRYCDYIYDLTLLDETAASLRDREIDEERVTEVVEDYFRRLHRRKDTGFETTRSWSRFEHDEMNISRLLRDDQEQISFVVGSLDLSLRHDVERVFRIRDRWDRRRELRCLAPRIALVTVSAWKSRSYTPSDIADPVPEGRDDPSFWFLHDDAYHPETGLCPTNAASSLTC